MRILPVILLCLALSACAKEEEQAAFMPEQRTAFQSVVVNTPGVTGADCVVQSGNSSYSVRAPGAVMVRRAPDTLSISCFKGDHMRGTASARPTFAPGEGNAVRGTQNACMTCNYPTSITVAMSLNGNAMDVPFMVWPN
jgi:hypothetical protein